MHTRTFFLSSIALVAQADEFVNVCRKSAASLRIWSDQLRKLSIYQAQPGVCPSFALGVGPKAIEAVSRNKTLFTLLHSVDQTTVAPTGTTNCYATGINPLCSLKVVDTYSPGANCLRTTLPKFMEIMAACLNPQLVSKKLVMCPTFDHNHSLILRETDFCAASYLRGPNNSTMAFSAVEMTDCQAAARSYNVCRKFGTETFKLAEDYCLAPNGWRGYCSLDFDYDIENEDLCTDLVVPALLWLGNDPTLSALVEQNDLDGLCNNVKTNYLVSLSKRKADAEVKTKAAQAVLDSSGVLLKRLNQNYLSPMVKFSAEQLQIAHGHAFERTLNDLTSFQSSHYSSLVHQRSISREMKAYLDYQAYLEEKRNPSKDREEKRKQTTPRPPVFPPYELNSNAVYVTVEVANAFNRVANTIDEVYSYQAAPITVNRDRWGRPHFVSMRSILKTAEEALIAMRRLPAEISKLKAVLDIETREPVRYSEILGYFDRYGGESSGKYRGNELSVPEIQRILTQGKVTIPQLIINNNKKLFDAAAAWKERYTNPDEMTQIVGETFQGIHTLYRLQLSHFITHIHSEL